MCGRNCSCRRLLPNKKSFYSRGIFGRRGGFCSSSLDDDSDDLSFNRCEAVHWNGKELKVLGEGEDNGAAFEKIILKSFDQLSSSRMKPLNSVGGSVSAEKDKDGSSEITGEAHITAKSDDGNTSVTATGEASVDNQGNYSGKVEVKVEHEF